MPKDAHWLHRLLDIKLFFLPEDVCTGFEGDAVLRDYLEYCRFECGAYAQPGQLRVLVALKY